MADIFISYAREDETHVQQLAHYLEEKGWSAFWDRHIPAGQTWRSHIGQALSDARCVVVAWTRHSITSDWVIEEAEVGQKRGVLVPVLLDVVDPPLGFRGIQAADLTEWRPGHPSAHFSQLLKDIDAVLETSAKSSEVEGVIEKESKFRDRREEQPEQKPKKLSWQVNKMLLAVLLIVVTGIGYLVYELTDFTSAPTEKSDEVSETTQDLPSEKGQQQGENTEGTSGSDSATPTFKPAQSSSLTVTGSGKATYYVYDASGEKELNYYSTGQIMELWPGTYQVELNKTRVTVKVKAGERTTL